MQDVSFYADAHRYDLAMGAFARGEQLDFYRRQIARYGDPVLELACGSGRLTIPLAQNGTNITGLDLSEEMLDLARQKAARQGVQVRLLPGDMRRFELGERFRLIFVPAQSLSHLYTRQEVEACFACVHQHLADGGRFLIELFNPSVKMLARGAGRYPVGQYVDPWGSQVSVTEEIQYDSATQVNHIRWFFREAGSEEETRLSFDMRQFYPQEIDALLWYNGFIVEHKYGSFDEGKFLSESPKQLIVCCPK